MILPIYLGIDLGTQSVRVLAADQAGKILAVASEPLTSKRDGVHHEQSPEEWWAATCICCRKVGQQLGSRTKLIVGLSVDATSGTIMIGDRNLMPVTPALMYDDGRAKAEAHEVNLAGESLWLQSNYRMQPSWALPKLLWLTRHFQLPIDARILHQNDFINARLAGRYLASDSSHSLKTGYDFLQSRWPADILAHLDLDLSLFPEVVIPGSRIGNLSSQSAEQTGLPAGTPIFAGMTDGCAAQIAAGAVAPGSWNSVLGTTLVIKGVTDELLHDPFHVVYSHRSPDGFWWPGGASNTGAGIINIEFPKADLARLDEAAKASGPSPIVAYPLMNRGERFPFFAPDATSFVLQHPTTPEERYSAILHGVAYLERLSFDYLSRMNAPMDGAFTFTGGAAKSHEWNQIRANILRRQIDIPNSVEPALGMAILVAAEVLTLRGACKSMVRTRETISPNRDFASYAEQYEQFVDELTERGWLSSDIKPTLIDKGIQ